MTKREFLKQLRGCLSQLNEADRDQVLLYWSEAIDDRLEAGMTEAEIFAELESPDIIALRILSELHTASQPTPPEQPKAEPVRTDARRKELEAHRAELEARRAALEAQIAALEQRMDAGSETMEDELDALEDELDALEDELDEIEEGGGFNLNIRIPEIKIPEINIPEIKLPNPEGKEWYFGFGDKGFGFRRSGEDAKPRRRHLDANPATVRELRVIDHNNGIQLELSPDDHIHIRWSENGNHKYDVTGEQGVLTLEHQQPEFLERIFGASRREKVVVQLPEGFAGMVDITTGNSGIRAERLRLSGQLRLSTKNSKLELLDIRAGQLRATTSNSRLTLEDVQAELIEARTSNSNLALSAVRARSLQARTSNAAIRVEDVDALSVSLITSNGGISGGLAGSEADYTVESSTSNGQNHNPTRPGGERKLVAKTSNASISLEFAN